MQLFSFLLRSLIIPPKAFFVLLVLSFFVARLMFEVRYHSVFGYNYYGSASQHYNTLDVWLAALSYFHQMFFWCALALTMVYYMLVIVILLLKAFFQYFKKSFF